jgi:hypothetical protein
LSKANAAIEYGMRVVIVEREGIEKLTCCSRREMDRVFATGGFVSVCHLIESMITSTSDFHTIIQSYLVTAPAG